MRYFWYLKIIKILLLLLSFDFAVANNATSIGFIVSIQKVLNNGYEHICMGTIIHEKFVVTAAHCLIDVGSASRISVVGGSNRFLSLKDITRFKVVRGISHKNFYPLFGYDIALIQISPKFDFSDPRFSKINFQNVLIDQKVEFIGWDENNEVLKIIDFKTVKRNTCLEKGFKYVTKVEVCAYSPAERGACNGDSGGPLISLDHKNIIGVLSYGKTSCLPNRLFSFTSIQSVEDWINKQISKALSGKYNYVSKNLISVP